MDQNSLHAVATSVRSLSMDAVQAANSGHPGLPLGCAELGALLYGEFLTHHPGDPVWANRDRFVLSAGHGSMFLYSLLHLSGYDLPLDELKRFRQTGSLTPGHPEYGHTPGVETTTGPLGQGISNAVGIAIGERMLAGTYNTADHTIIDHYTYVLAGDGDMMEGISSEASSLAGYLGLGKLIVFYDDNGISIDGSTDITFTEDVGARFSAYDWHVQHCDGYAVDAIRSAVGAAKASQKPSLIVLKTVIGKGSPNKAGTSEVHGSPLGDDEIVATRENLGLAPDAAFYVDPAATTFFASRRSELAAEYENWGKTYLEWREANPVLAERWDQSGDSGMAVLKSVTLPEFELGGATATRKASASALTAIAETVPFLVGGSADLAASNNTALPAHGIFSVENPTGRTINFGVREHAMGAISNGLALSGNLRPFCATFLVFSDYMRGSIRLAALMGLPVIYVFTHDSIFVGEDGPTHQPVEHTAALRIIPGLDVLRPGDGEETAQAWMMAMERTDGPTALILTRQNLVTYAKPEGWKDALRRGAYIVADSEGASDVVIAASGSEVNLALEAARKSSRKVRVVSIISQHRFLQQDATFRDSLLPPSAKVVAAEVGVSQTWAGIASSPDLILGLDRFGASGPAAELATEFGITPENLLALVERA